MINILAHRGMWKNTDNQNTEDSFLRALENNFGIETDIRDYGGELVVSHDIPSENSMKFLEFLRIYKKFSAEKTIAVNIKSDGLHDLIDNILNKEVIKNYFVFDMSIPDSLGYIKKNISTFLRISEYENYNVLFKSVDGIWLDSFNSDWFNESDIKDFLNRGKKLCIISPEIHKRDHKNVWKLLKESNFHINNQVYICTDLPLEAKNFFDE